MEFKGILLDSKGSNIVDFQEILRQKDIKLYKICLTLLNFV